MCALKLSTKNAQSHREMHNELRILRYLKSEHPALPQLKDYFYDSKGNIAIVLEYLNTSLGDYVGEGNLLPERAARKIFHTVLHCVDFLHQKGLAHRDLKVENLMFVPDASQKQGKEVVDAPFSLSVALPWKDKGRSLLSRSLPLSFFHFLSPRDQKIAERNEQMTGK